MTHESNARPNPLEAQQALDSVADSQRALAPFVRSPAWLYPTQGIAVALFIIGLVLFNSHSWAILALGTSIIIFCVLPVLQSARSRVIIDVYTHRGSRALGLLYLAGFAVLVIGALVVHALSGSEWAAYIAGLLALVLTLVCGPAMDKKLAASLGTPY
ncbi:Positive regulator of sigma(E), RseC/MucC [Arthrobacter ulcerisalmonis]|uniref:Positive regulator of sigma(E), RseC/MucC n=1 Tax=Arthrobacter ulcerisalmonis TaxID=2483813 RepID=A0A3P5X6W2_9MICC|nr:SoxR reducing system RseC family protein [Arthrobacter ulcerisalmonis]VDC30311.1 Positive regulator of sigma(E), RseC/MucC [Arthrobacter ulcerisalmonis]